MAIDPAELMKLAIAKAQEGIAAGQTPFGAAIALGDNVVAVSHNTVWATTDITAHAEINALREACRATGQIHLTGAIVAATCEPCPMCMAALHWARVGVVYFGASVADATKAGFNELQLSAQEVTRTGGDQVQVVPGLLTEQCRGLFAEWKNSKLARGY